MFLRAFLAVFHPELAEEAGVRVRGVLDDDELFSFHIGLQGRASEEVVEYLATAVSAEEMQLCYERMMELSVGSHAAKEYDRVKFKSKAARRSGRVNAADKKAAQAVKDKCLLERSCFSLGFLEQCNEPDGKFLAQVVRVAQSGLVVHGTLVPDVKWAEKCTCAAHHAQHCWATADRLYKFMKTEFFHVYVHQMLAEGCFNILDHTQKNASSDLKAAALQVKVRTAPSPTPRNDTSLMFVCVAGQQRRRQGFEEQ